MRKRHRYGDEGTIVTLREQGIAVLFVIGIAALLIGPVAIPYDEPLGTIARTSAALHAASGAEPSSRSDDVGRAARDPEGTTP